MLAIAAMVAAGCDETQIPDDPGKQDQKDTTQVTPPEPKPEPIKVESITIDPENLELEVGQEYTLSPVVTPEAALETNPIMFSTDDPDVAEVDISGKVTAIKEGQASIKMECGEKSVVCKVTVIKAFNVNFSNISISDIAFSSVTLNGVINVQGTDANYVSAVFYYLETNETPTAEAIKKDGKNSISKTMATPGGEFSVLVQQLAVGTRYCFVAATDIDGVYYFSEVQSFTTAELPALKETVDMGLSVKWRGWNVGATKPEEFGDFFAWGETATKDNYVWESYAFRASYDRMTKYCTRSGDGTVDGLVTLLPADDAASVKLGSAWRMPTVEEMTALMNNSDMKWTRYNGVYGIVMTSKLNGGVLFFPAGGYRYGHGGGSVHSGEYGEFWTASLNPDNNKKAYQLIIKSQIRDIMITTGADRYYGANVRPVAVE